MALILFNKPYGVLCQFTEESNGPARPTLLRSSTGRRLSRRTARYG